MSKILIQGQVILAINVTEHSATVMGDDIVYPKAALNGWTIIEANLPGDYAPGRYCWQAGGFVAIAEPIDQALAAKLAALAAYRYQRETGGITVGGVAVTTDRESQGMLAGALAFVSLAPEVLIDWKGANGWAQINADGVGAIAHAVGAHVQACFTAERHHSEALGQLTTVAEIEAYDITTTGWPV